MDVKYPEVTVKLTGGSGNVFAIVGTVSRALRRAGLPDAAAEFRGAALRSGSYDEVLQLCMKTVNVE